MNVGLGKDHTLYAKVDGRVAFERAGKTKQRVSVYALSDEPNPS
jgi:large subunit ribosomal protein L27